MKGLKNRIFRKLVVTDSHEVLQSITFFISGFNSSALFLALNMYNFLNLDYKVL